MTKPIRQFRGQYRFLSNFWLCVITLPDDMADYHSVEHAYQAAKTDDKVTREVIRLTSAPGKAKYMGRDVPLRPHWEEMKIDLMTDLVRQKFLTNSYLMDCLLATGDAELIEGNHWGDRFWGCVDNGYGPGENWLGRILMKFREEMKVSLCS